VCTEARHLPLIKLKKSLLTLERQKHRIWPIDHHFYCDSRLFITDGLTSRSKPLGLDPIHLALTWFGQIRPSGLSTGATSSSILGDFWQLRQYVNIHQCDLPPSPQPNGATPWPWSSRRYPSTAWWDSTGKLWYSHCRRLLYFWLNSTVFAGELGFMLLGVTQTRAICWEWLSRGVGCDLLWFVSLFRAYSHDSLQHPCWRRGIFGLWYHPW
jgi:hypothetical protein